MSNNRELRVNMIDILETLVRRKWAIIGFAFLLAIGAAIISLLLPLRYQAVTVLMPPSSSETSSIKSILKNTPLGKLGGMAQIAGGIPSDLSSIYMAILSSRSLKVDVIRKFNLVHVYKFDKGKRYFMEDVLKRFDKNINFDLTDEGTLFLTVEDESPKRAAAMANYMTQRLDEIYGRLMNEKNSKYREFLGERLTVVKADLEVAEKNLLAFQKRNHMMDIEGQAKATLTTGVNLEARYLALQGNLEIAQKTYSADHPRVREMKLQLEQLEKQRRALAGDKGSAFLLPYQTSPDLGLEYLQLRREQEIQQSIFELMIQQYEEAKFEESKNTPNVQVLDPAEPPQKKIGPKRRRMVQITFLVGLLLGSLGVLIRESAGKFTRKRPEESARLRRLLRQAWAIRSPR